MITVSPTKLADVKLITSQVVTDESGHLFQASNERELADLGIKAHFVQDSVVSSGRGVVRGLYFQHGSPQGRLVRPITGRVFDVVVDIRRNSKTFGQWTAETLTAGDGRALWIPAGFAHGYMILSETADVYFKRTGYWTAEDQRTVRWNDPAIGIEWPIAELGVIRKAPISPIVSGEDAGATLLSELQW